MNTENLATIPIASIEEILTDLRHGKMVVITDDENRENEGDLLMAAQFVTAESINFMATHAKGLICLTLPSQRCDYLGLTPMTKQNNSQYSTAFTVSIEAREGVTTGISAADRATTIKVAVAPDAKPHDLVQPGHVFPLRAVDGGVLVRAGHTEAGVDLARLAGLNASAVICEIMNEDGSMARMPQLKLFAAKHNLKIATIADLIAYRNKTEKLVELLGEKPLTTPWGSFIARLYKDKPTQTLHLALKHGQWGSEDVVPVRVHETKSSLDFIDCNKADGVSNWSLDAALKYILKQPFGLAVILGGSSSAQEIVDLFNNNPASDRLIKFDNRNYGIGAQIIKDCQADNIKIIGSVRNYPSLTEGYGINIIGNIQEKE